jgi:hypothetical protein
MSEEAYAAKAKPDRPGCLSIYAILLWLGGGLAVIGLCLLTASGGLFGGPIGIFEICLGSIYFLLVVLGITAGIGIWQMRRWGLVLALVLQSLSIITSALTALAFVAGSSQNLSYAFGNLVGLAINGFIIYWFITNRALFNGGTNVVSTAGPGGESVYQPAQQKRNDAAMALLAIGGVVAIGLLVCIVVIAILAILGPQIGNVFSQITYTLDNPPPAIAPWVW